MNRPPVPDPRRQAPGAATDGLVQVHILAAPLLLCEEASQHTDELLREFAIIQIGAEQGADDVPVRLAALIDELWGRYAGVIAEPTLQRQAAIAAEHPCAAAVPDWYLGEFVRQVAGEPPVAWPDAGPTGTSVPWGP